VVTTAAACLLLMQLCGCVAIAAALPMKDGGGGKDPKQPLNTRIDDLLGRMTLAEKIGQMSQIERENATADVVNKYLIGMCTYAYASMYVWTRRRNLSFVGS
jgi:beta-glucosidase